MIEIHDKALKGIKFIDLFAGIGGFHYALGSYGAECVYASEWDKHAAETYSRNHNMAVDGDITKVNEKDIPSHDVLCGGFPCQAFSISGKQLGFEDTRGTLFFDIARIAAYHKPKVLFMENVKNLVQHDGGKTFKTILTTLEGLGYKTHFKVLNSGHFGIPQHRERIYIVAFRNDIANKDTFRFPSMELTSSLNDILEDNPNDAKIIERNDIHIYKSTANGEQRTLFGEKTLPNKPLQIGIVNKGGQGERIYDPIGHSITLSANGGGAGAKTGLYFIDNKVRKLSTRECARLQGFPESFIIPSSSTVAYKQFGNSVTIDVLQYIVGEIIKVVSPEKDSITLT
ncbi:MAG: DNA cytosine methyltransferase [Bacteroidales bacterium]|nr:DNA cytosine methyltransferase [Bacteroidales bacterium]